MFESTLAGVKDKPGCPATGLYNQIVKDRMFTRVATLPVPEDPEAAQTILDFLVSENCNVPAATAAYRLRLEGLDALKKRTTADFSQHLDVIQQNASRQHDLDAASQLASIKATLTHIKDRKQQQAWATEMLAQPFHLLNRGR